MIFAGLVFLSMSTKWYDPIDSGFNVIQNQGFVSEIGKTYHRLPERFKDIVRTSVWDLSRHSSSLSIHFMTDSDFVRIELETEAPYSFDMMSQFGTNGIDLYAYDTYGIPSICNGGYIFSKNSVVYEYNDLMQARHQFRLFLPSFDVVKSVKIGVTDGKDLRFLPTRKERPIVVYGTSVVQGSSANRPGLDWVNWMSREVDFPVLNFGFMGQSLLEKEVIGAIIENNAQAYILDCLSDLVWLPTEKIVELLMSAYGQIRAKWSKTPIVFIQFPGYSNQLFDWNNKKYFENVNDACQKAYENLIKQGANDLHIITADEIQIKSDDIVDNYHLNDIGMKKMTETVVRKLRDILDLKVGQYRTQVPITLNIHSTFHERLNQMIELIQNNNNNNSGKFQNAIIGDSITHFWGGEPWDGGGNGRDSWEKYFDPQHFINFGISADRIENALFRAYHDLFFNISFGKVISLLGCNNVYTDQTDTEITEGLRFILRQIQARQPKARIIVVGVLPSGGKEERIVGLNVLYEKMAKEEKWTFVNPGVKLAKEDGKVNPIYFLPGDLTHPNAAGYRMIAQDITEA